MGKMNMKLMQGIGDAELLLQKEKQSETDAIPEVEKEQKDMKSEGEKNAPSGSIKKTSEDTKKAELPKNRMKTKKKVDKGQKQVFSFRAFIGDINIWKAYVTAVGETTMEDIGSAAMNEYIKHHKLTGAELAIFDAILAREKK